VFGELWIWIFEALIAEAIERFLCGRGWLPIDD
jgi:hypothetical protein